jgi:hypothetical protein
MSDITKISLGKLFADLQVSYTEVKICELIEFKGAYLKDDSRKIINLSIINTITAELARRLSIKELNDFLDNGYPRYVNLKECIPINKEQN